MTSLNDIALWNHVVFEEIDHTWTIRSCKGLQHIYEYWKRRIFDNHNHALYFRTQFLTNKKSFPVIHIDQHSDLGSPPTSIEKENINDLEYIREYTNYICNVWNFIPPALESWIIQTCEQIRSESKLLEYKNPHHEYILDIDLDFRAPEMSINKFEKTIEKTKELITNASLVTVASSPYFIDQSLALTILKKLW